jgi:hypothetical protein
VDEAEVARIVNPCGDQLLSARFRFVRQPRVKAATEAAICDAFLASALDEHRSRLLWNQPLETRSEPSSLLVAAARAGRSPTPLAVRGNLTPATVPSFMD